MHDSDDKLKLLAEDGEAENTASGPPKRVWKLLIVDDEEEVHQVTTLALEHFDYYGRKLEFVHAYSGTQAREVLAEHSDIAVILLDVVMETDQAGLELVKYIRGQLNNSFVRIILRTGQPGQAPEHAVITDYDINDYKNKTELTRDKLFTTVYTSLSAYRDLTALEANRRGLRKIIEASAKIFEVRSMDHFAQGVLEQLTALLYLDRDAVVICGTSGIAAQQRAEGMRILAGTGCYENAVGQDARKTLAQESLQLVEQALTHHESQFTETEYVGYYRTESGVDHVLYVADGVPISLHDRDLMDLFCRNVAIAHENVLHMHQNRQDQREE